MNQCMSLHASDQGFPNKGGVNSSSVKGDGKLSRGDLVYMVVGTWGGVILTIRTFFEAKNNIL